ncbi:hypothetical protein Agub_g2973, partial [Astrephomene gubernaculifera]
MGPLRDQPQAAAPADEQKQRKSRLNEDSSPSSSAVNAIPNLLVMTITAAAAVLCSWAAVHLFGQRRRQRQRQWGRVDCGWRPQEGFRVVFADTSDKPFPHLPPQPCEVGALDGGGGSTGSIVITSTKDGDGASASIAATNTSATPTAAVAAVAVAAEAGLTTAVPEPATGGASIPAVVTPTTAGVVHPYLPHIQRLMAATHCAVRRHPLPPPP